MKTLYFDTNIIIYFKDNYSIENINLLARASEKFNCYFSDYNLLEFLNCSIPESITTQSNILKLLNAKLIKQEFDYAEHSALDKFGTYSVDIDDYLRYLKSDESLGVRNAIQSMHIHDLHHFHGGSPSDTPIEISSRKFANFLQLSKANKDNIIRLFSDLTDEDKTVFYNSCGITVDNYISLVFEKFKQYEFDYLKALSESVAMENKLPRVNFSNRCQALRDQLDLKCLQLNNIEGSDVIRKICTRLREHGHYPNLSDEEIFGLHKNFIRPGQPLHIHEKIRIILSQLNTLGYQKDEKLKKLGKVRAHSFDLDHAIIAGTVEYFCCEDVKFSARLSATFEYLGITTKVITLQELTRLVL